MTQINGAYVKLLFVSDQYKLGINLQIKSTNFEHLFS